ncbi:NAD(P)H-dependent oxidoreductase [Faecalibacter sp. LW9]|uniref:NAD(P)H-dependent oxidoreductase n=1 Tax=Faecalibacter sp. LW9 TaxID=3103144 RepID=UPI002B00318D|nr:NAD(P)H-dependent oxidoreductase [Faecalibacter sp. LW9]
MKNILIVNGAIRFAHSGGTFNSSLVEWTTTIAEKLGNSVKIVNVQDEFDPMQEVENFKWADVIIYHTPIWWFHLPSRFKYYLDEVLTAGYNNGMYKNDGRSHINPSINYGTGGLMQGKFYMVTSTWNAPEEAFTLEGEFFKQTSVDDGILFGFHRMNDFLGLTRLDGMHFHDLEKNGSEERILKYKTSYQTHLEHALKAL